VGGYFPNPTTLKFLSCESDSTGLDSKAGHIGGFIFRRISNWDNRVDASKASKTFDQAQTSLLSSSWSAVLTLGPIIDFGVVKITHCHCSFQNLITKPL
jgi:hypothetical protein